MLLNVPKMTCSHCVRSISAAVHTIDPRATVEADVAGRTVRIDGNPDVDAAVQAIREAGYAVEVLQR